MPKMLGGCFGWLGGECDTVLKREQWAFKELPTELCESDGRHAGGSGVAEGFCPTRTECWNDPALPE